MKPPYKPKGAEFGEILGWCWEMLGDVGRVKLLEGSWKLCTPSPCLMLCISSLWLLLSSLLQQANDLVNKMFLWVLRTAVAKKNWNLKGHCGNHWFIVILIINTGTLDLQIESEVEGQSCWTEPLTCGTWSYLWMVSELSWTAGHPAGIQTAACMCEEHPSHTHMYIGTGTQSLKEGYVSGCGVKRV